MCIVAERNSIITEYCEIRKWCDCVYHIKEFMLFYGKVKLLFLLYFSDEILILI